MIFVTVGTVAPFDRLIRTADEVAAHRNSETWFGQIGDGAYEPRHMSFVRFLDKAEYDRRVRTADFIVGHGGIGIISDALTNNKPLLVLPRIARLGEHVNDHQVETVRYYGEHGYVLVAKQEDDFSEVFDRLLDFTPKQRVTEPEKVARRIADFLATVVGS